MTAPDVFVEFAPGHTWQDEPASITWVDITDLVLQPDRISVQRGASAARGEIDVGSCSLALKNADRRFDPTHTAGPYYGDLLPGVPIRVLGTSESGYIDLYEDIYTGGTPVPIFTGTVAKWPQRYHIANKFSWVPVDAYDGFDKLSRAKIPQAAYPLEVLADNPTVYWRLDEQDGNVMLDSSSNNLHGLYDNAVLGQDPLITDGNGHSARFEHVGDNRGQYIGTSLPVQAPITLEAWVQVERDLTQTRVIMAVQRDNANGSSLTLGIETSGTGSPDGELIINFRGLGGFYKARGHTRIDDGEPHHVVMTMSSTAAADIKLYVDGVLQTKTVISGTTGGTWLGHHLWVVGNYAALTASDFGVDGQVDEVAIYPAALSAARVLAHYQAGYQALAGQRTDQRVGYVLDTLNWPTNLRDLEVGQSFLGEATFQAGDEALDYLRLITESEDGLLFMEPDGTLRFHDRFWRYLNTLATVSQFTFSDATTSASYAEFDLDIDDELLVNTARFTRRGGSEQVATDATSVNLYGEADKQKSDLLLRTDAEVLALAQWTVVTRSVPLPRVPKIRVPLHRYSLANQEAVLALDLGHRVTARRTPQGVGTQVSIDFQIDGIRHDIGGGEWWWEAYVSPVPEATVQMFLLSDSLMSGTDVLAY